MSNETGAATPHHVLMDRLMDPRIAKSELEWAASREVEQLRSKLAAAREALEKIASGTVYNPSKLAADSLAQLRESGAGREGLLGVVETDCLGWVAHDGTRSRWLTREGKWVTTDEARKIGESRLHFASEIEATDALIAAKPSPPPTEAMAKCPTCAAALALGKEGGAK